MSDIGSPAAMPIHGEPSMPDILAQAREDVALANRILANEGVFDAFGHVSLRHPQNPEHFLISRHRAPELVQPADILVLDLDGKPAVPTPHRLYGEVTIHASIFRARPDVMAICHHHAPAVLPYAIARTEMFPVYHLGASMGAKVPFWDSRDEFGDTALVVVDPAEGKSLAKALGAHSIVLMGAAVGDAGDRVSATQPAWRQSRGRSVVPPRSDGSRICRRAERCDRVSLCERS